MKEKFFEGEIDFENNMGKLEEYIFDFDFSVAKGKVKQVYFDGIMIHGGVYNSKECFSLHGITDTPTIELHINLKGTTVSKMKAYKDEIIMKPDDCNLFYSSATEGYITSEKSQEHNFISINIIPQYFDDLIYGSKNLFESFTKNIDNYPNRILTNKNIKVTPEMKTVVYQIMNCNITGKFRSVYLKSKITELLVLLASKAESTVFNFSFSRSDGDKLNEAKEELIKDLTDPPSINYLSRKVGLNEFKLKKGFKELFGNTIYGYLLDYKLDKAKIDLVDNKKSISEIAFETGYSSQAHFSTAFKKKFGCSPSSIR